MRKRVRSFHHEYFAKGYKIDHHMQKHKRGCTHLFILHDYGGARLPTATGILKKFVLKRTPNWVVTNKVVEITGTHHVRYSFTGFNNQGGTK